MVKYEQNVSFFKWELKIKLLFLFASVQRFSLLIEKYPHLTMHCLEYLFHMDNHIDLERIIYENGTPENICKTK